MSDTREHLHQLIDRLPPAQLDVAAGLLEAMLDPRCGQRPAEKEAISDEEEHAVAEAKRWLRENGGKGIPHEEILAEFGLTVDDFRRMGEQRAERRRA